MDWNILIVDLGQAVIPWAVTLLLGVLTKYAFSKIKNDTIRHVVTQATTEAFDAASEIHQTYVKAIKKGRADGKLTAKEKQQAKSLAVAAAKSNLGPKGFARLARIVGGKFGATTYLASKVEAAVSSAKK